MDGTEVPFDGLQVKRHRVVFGCGHRFGDDRFARSRVGLFGLFVPEPVLKSLKLLVGEWRRAFFDLQFLRSCVLAVGCHSPHPWQVEDRLAVLEPDGTPAPAISGDEAGNDVVLVNESHVSAGESLVRHRGEERGQQQRLSKRNHTADIDGSFPNQFDRAKHCHRPAEAVSGDPDMADVMLSKGIVYLPGYRTVGL